MLAIIISPTFWFKLIPTPLLIEDIKPGDSGISIDTSLPDDDTVTPLPVKLNFATSLVLCTLFCDTIIPDVTVGTAH